MSRELNTLKDNFRIKVEIVLKECSELGYPMKPFFTLRSPFVQGKLWRQSRTGPEIKNKIEMLRMKKCDFLADCIELVGPQNGKWATNAIPGLSWHQHGLAVDCFWLLDGKAEWSQRKLHNGKNGYSVYAEVAKNNGLNAGHFWKHKDSVHIQMHGGTSPLLHFNNNLSEIDSIMKKMFSSEHRYYKDLTHNRY